MKHCTGAKLQSHEPVTIVWHRHYAVKLSRLLNYDQSDFLLVLIAASFEYKEHGNYQGKLVFSLQLVFVKDTSLYFTSHSHERQRREIVITSAKHEAERR